MSKTTTRVLQVRLVLSSLPPHLELPVGSITRCRLRAGTGSSG